MTETGPTNPLADRLREREEQEAEQYTAYRRRVQHPVKRELREREATWARSSDAAHARIEKSYRQRTAALNKHGLTVVIAAALVGLAIYGGVWGLAQWSAKGLRADLVNLERQTAREEAILENLEAQTWGVELFKSQEGQRYVVLPMGANIVAERFNGRTAAVVPTPASE